MHRRALHFALFLSALAPSVPALAHGLPAEAYAILSRDAEGLRAVSLSAGVALRRAAQRYEYVCPAAWGDQFPAPVAALADGTIVVGTAGGLMLLDQAGTLRRHPDAAAIGRSTEVVRSAHGVFSLRSTPEGSEVLAIDAQAVRVLWKDTNSMSSLAALGDRLILLRASGTMLEQVTIAAADGAQLDRQMAVIDLPMDNAFARATAGAAYALVLYRNGTVALGSLAMNAFTKFADGALSIAGPLSTGGVTLVALDGKLAQLVDGHAMPFTDDQGVGCLAEHDALTYACNRDGIARVSEQAVAEPLFRFEWLVPPDLERIPGDEERFLCESQWQDLRFDLKLFAVVDGGTAPVDSSVADSGVDAPLADAGLADSGIDAQAVAGGPALAPEPQAPRRNTGCATSSGRNAPRAAYELGLVIAFARLRCLRRRSRRRQTLM